MKRKLCRSVPFNCDDMEELSAVALSRRKESAAPLTGERDLFGPPLGYPLALILRLRVLQIVCGISGMVMGSVAFIEERQKFNMGLGIPAGGISVLAAAVSIHTARGAGTVVGGMGVAATSALWAAAACCQLALVVLCARTVLGLEHMLSFDKDSTIEEDSLPSPRDLIVIACVQITLAAATLLSAAFCARIDCMTRK